MLTDDTMTKVQHELYLKLAVAHLRRLNERRRMYEEECQRDAAQGYRPHYCIHGTNQWTDYDNICGPCEDGLTDQELALSCAFTDVRAYLTRLDMVSAFTKAGKDTGQHVDRSITDAIWPWAMSPLDILKTHKRPIRNLP